MIYTAIVLFALGAVLGLSMLVKWLGKKGASKTVVYSHGLVGAIALVLLVIYSLQHPDNFPKASLILFVIAALGGFYLFFSSLKKETGSVGLALVHGLLAVCGFIALLLFAFA